jgi:MoaA/NifB/PqqE/SkfB family radical SAM enzyme
MLSVGREAKDENPRSVGKVMNRSLSLPIDAFDFLWMELTPRCNLNCVHCYADSSPQRPLEERMQLADWVDALNQAADLGCKRAQFIGGEPTLYPGLAELIEHARYRGFETLEVFTNGTVLTDKLKSVFVRCNVNLAFSVYAAREDVHDGVTRQKGSLTKTLASIRWALDAGLTVRTAIVSMGVNVDQIAETQGMLHAMGVPSVSDDRIRGIGRGSREVRSDNPLKEMCGACGRDQLCVSSDGQIYPCVFSHFCPLGSFKDGLAPAVRGHELHTFRRALRSSRREAAADPDRELEAQWDVSPCNPETPATSCGPEAPAPPCGPEIPPPPCEPEIPQGPCNPERAAMHWQ